MRPMRSSLGMRLRPRKTPSRLTLMRHSPLGLAPSGVCFDASVVRYGWGSGWWKYQYRVTQSIMAICLVGLAAGLKSLLEGFEMEEMKRLSFCKVGFFQA
ncbi:hypothetical protein HYQ46_012071 [Verticillium longisporum]|nr:hypothetical protein HYQ46_012071 [Verticillium longisporum]